MNAASFRGTSRGDAEPGRPRVRVGGSTIGAPGRRAVLALALPAVLACCLPLRAGPDSVEALEKAAGDWVKARAEAARIDSEWRSQQPLLTSMVGGFAERATSLEARRDYLVAKTARDREEISALQAANNTSAEGLAATEAQLKAMAGRLLELRPSLPPRLSEALELPYRSLAGAGLAPGERAQLVMTVLNRCTQFNRTITCEEEMLTPEPGRPPQLLEVIYWGLSHAYALDRPAARAWFGSPGPSGWQWEPLAGGAEPVVRLIEVYRGKVEPRFIEIPARLGHPAAEAPVK